MGAHTFLPYQTKSKLMPERLQQLIEKGQKENNRKSGAQK